MRAWRPLAPLALAVVACAGAAVWSMPAADGQTPPAPELPTDFLVDELTPGRTDDGTPVVLLGVDNTGGRTIDLRGELELSDGPGGAAAGPFEVASAGPAPEQRGTLEVVLGSPLPRGPWQASVTLTAGEVERRAVAVIGFPETGLGDPVPTERLQERTVLAPVAAGSLLGLLAALVVVVAWQQREGERARRGAALAERPRPRPREVVRLP